MGGGEDKALSASEQLVSYDVFLKTIFEAICHLGRLLLALAASLRSVPVLAGALVASSSQWSREEIRPLSLKGTHDI